MCIQGRQVWGEIFPSPGQKQLQLVLDVIAACTCIYFAGGHITCTSHVAGMNHLVGKLTPSNLIPT